MPEAGLHEPSGSGGATGAGLSEGSGGLIFHVDASPRAATGGASEPPFDPADLARCQELEASARRDVAAAIALSCADDSECAVFIPESECARGCLVPGRADSTAAIEKAIAAANEKWCTDFDALNCPLAIPECILMRSACVRGQCQLFPGELYRFDIADLMDSGETIVATKIDVSTGTCVLAEFVVTTGDPAARFRRAVLIPDARSCCPLAALAELASCDASPTCAWTVAAPNPTGSASIGPRYTLDVDYTFSFPRASRDVEFRTMELARGGCIAP